jgi:RNA polymerase sigma-70 factor (ECF subfamily)
MRKPSRREAELHFALEADDGESALLPATDSDPYDAVRRTQLSARIQHALDQLPPYHRGVILMREVEGMSYEEMAEAMQVSKGTIMSRLFHARKKLQRALLDSYEEECRGAKSA